MKVDKLYKCPNCESPQVEAGVENRGPVIVLFARCRDCGIQRQSMAMVNR